MNAKKPGIKGIYNTFGATLGNHNIKHPDRKVIRKMGRRSQEAEGCYRKLILFVKRKTGLYISHIIFSIILILFFNLLGQKADQLISIVSLAAVMLAGVVSLIVLKTNQSIEMLKLKEKAHFSLKNELSDFFFYFYDAAKKPYEIISEKYLYTPEAGFATKPKALENVKITLQPIFDECNKSDPHAKMEQSYSRILSRINDNSNEHIGISRLVIMLRVILDDYERLMTLDQISIEDKFNAHSHFRNIFIDGIATGRRYTTNILRKNWERALLKTTDRNEDIRSLYLVLMSIIIGLSTAVTDFSITDAIVSSTSFLTCST